MLGASPYPLSVARLAFNLTKVRKVRKIELSQRAIIKKESKMPKLKADFWTLYYGELEGATILNFVEMRRDEFNGSDFPVFLVKFSNGSIGEIEISRDEEGNGGGFIFGLPLPS